MNGGFVIFLVLVVASGIGVVGGYLLRKGVSRRNLESTENLSARIISEAKKEAENIKKEAILKAKDYLLKAKNDFESDTRMRKLELDKLENRLY